MAGCVVLLSAGLDSTYNLFAAREQGLQVVRALTFDYGQRAAAREISSAARLCRRLEISHTVLSLPFFRDFTRTALVARAAEVPQASVDIADMAASRASAAKVWVPNRNGILLNIAAGYAEGLGAEFVVPGFNREEAATFADNSLEFIAALDGAFLFSTANHVRVRCFSSELDKAEIVARSLKLGVPLAELWPCYQDGAKLCGACESCLRFARALRANGQEFPG